MQKPEIAIDTSAKRTPWNKGKLTGAKPPLRPKHVWSIRTKLQVRGKVRDWRCSTSPSIASCVGAMSSP
jgi:hypothetical protein